MRTTSNNPLRPGISVLSLLFILALFVYASNAGAQGDGPLSKLEVHGFLTQAFATANFSEGASPTTDEIVIGIPEEGTFDYRSLAIQFRYAISPKDTMVIQFSSRALGSSPIGDLEDEIELDWAFYERQLGDRTSIKLGRVQIPLGIFNEIRDVGTLLPFYRPSFSFYREGSFTSETVDGVMISHTFAADSEWSLEADFYVGEWDLVEFDSFSGFEAKSARAEDAFGVQLWLNTPISGLRFGLGGHQRDVTEGAEAFRLPGESDRFKDYYVSVDLALERFVFRGEYRKFSAEPSDVFFGGDFPLYYIQVGFHPHEKFRIYGQYEFTQAKLDEDDTVRPLGFPLTGPAEADLRSDTGIALNYVFSPNMVLKLEHHFDIDAQDFIGIVPVVTDEGLKFDPVFSFSEDGEYSILSFSTSF